MKIITALAFPLILCAAVSFYACNGKTSPTSPPNAVTDTVSPSIDSDLISVYTARIEYYEELIHDLEADLLYEKEENYIKLVEYGLEIKNLKEALAALENIDVDTSPASPQPQDKPSPEVESSSPSNLSSSSPFDVQTCKGGLVISGYRGSEREITIPSQIGGLPVVAIGGIHAGNLLELSGSGVDGVAVVSAIFAADNPGEATARLLELAKEMVANG